MEVRLDKWLSVARIYKTRSQASRACALGRVRVNGLPAKAHRLLSVDDTIRVKKGAWEQILIVKRLWDKSLPKADARELFEDQSPPRPRLDAIDRILQRPPIVREKGSGRPTKKERRKLERIRRQDS